MERKEILTIVMISVLLLTTAIQTVQLVSLGSAQVVVPATASSGTPVTGSSGSAGTNLADLPSMVGGC